MMGRPIAGRWASSPGFRWPPLRLVRVRSERVCVDVVCPQLLPVVRAEEEIVRAIGLDVHLEFCEVAICEGGEVRSAGRIETRPERDRALCPEPGQGRSGRA